MIALLYTLDQVVCFQMHNATLGCALISHIDDDIWLDMSIQGLNFLIYTCSIGVQLDDTLQGGK